MKITSFLIVSIALLCSCDKKQNSQIETQTAAVSSEESPKTADTAAVVSASPNVVASAPQKENVVETATSPSGKPALNPPHGQPYHRCDIEVGAPIDSPAKKVSAPPVAPQQAPANNSFNTNPISASPSVPSVQPAPSSGPKPATNPAHGQPHHRCDLAVGAPLI